MWSTRRCVAEATPCLVCAIVGGMGWDEIDTRVHARLEVTRHHT